MPVTVPAVEIPDPPLGSLDRPPCCVWFEVAPEERGRPTLTAEELADAAADWAGSGLDRCRLWCCAEVGRPTPSGGVEWEQWKSSFSRSGGWSAWEPR